MGRLGTSGTAEPTVSVVIPTYERREYVCRAVRSVFAQRYRDWELIVVDDGSTDGTEQALAAFGPRLRYLWQENRGVSAARNAGLALARGEIVAFLDSDDRWLPDHLETVVAMLERHPEAVLACTCPRSDVAGRQRVDETRLVDALPHLLIDNIMGTAGVAVPRHHLRAVDGFDERLAVIEDGELWLRLATRGPFALLQRRTLVRQHTRGSLVEQATRSGEYLRAMVQMGQSAAAKVASLERSDSATLRNRAEGKIRYCDALRALRDGSTEATRSALRDACLRLPELSSDPWFVDRRLKSLSLLREERLRYYETTARLWPDPRCDTALFLRLSAIVRALRLGNPRRAFDLVRDFPACRAPSFLLRARPLIALLLRRRVHTIVHRGADVRPAPVSTGFPGT